MLGFEDMVLTDGYTVYDTVQKELRGGKLDMKGAALIKRAEGLLYLLLQKQYRPKHRDYRCLDRRGRLEKIVEYFDIVREKILSE